MYQTYWWDFDIKGKESQINSLTHESADAKFWSDTRIAQTKMRQLSNLKKEVSYLRELERTVDSIYELVNLIDEEDIDMRTDVSNEIQELQHKVDDWEVRGALEGPFVKNNVIMAIHAGAGGTESQDWVSILLRMYSRWAEHNSMKIDIVDLSQGEESGIKSVVTHISGDMAYGYLKSEHGVHRLVRLSPFDADHARHTSFALVEVLPEVEQGVDISINEDDLKIDVFRASGAGGQSVQKNSTAIRITHLPTGIKVQCQNERSQYQNKLMAMSILSSRLIKLQKKNQDIETSKLKGAYVSAEWGNQIRSYVLHPYKLVKDHRTGYETSSAEEVLNGEIDKFINIYLKWISTKKKRSKN